MNKRIKELWEQSRTSGVHPKFGVYDKYSVEKFAELIIADLDKVLTDNFYGDPHEIPDFIEDVKKHFGVEE